ncbi:flavin reductase family protein [Arthrobacter sp. Sa2CUA1]|uniref:Flavin reductase family protein n=1 Tax=Arthrobacter gallicola TaxID=2762225 RepID=A0ABR8UQV4_9MICC|nr:flavin reductase family protein [Arthrobacter gallicola]MBD7994899.1 flavin reductase family protein [Arthrobacter gallicola]
MTSTAVTNPVVDEFKDAFRGHPAGVAIITASGSDGPVGLTASSVASVSALPPILAFSLASTQGTAGVIAAADTIVVHLLGADNAGLAALFAARGAERFGPDLEWDTLPGGEPLLKGVPRALLCRVLSLTQAGSSTLVAAAVQEIYTGPAAAPLVYHDRTYHRLSTDSAL